MSENVLIVGSYCPKGLDSFDWWQDLPNIADYDTIILDTTRIFNFWSSAGRLEYYEGNTYFLQNASEIDEKIKSNIHLIHKKLLEILEFDVNIYVLYLPNIDISAGITHFDMSGDALIPFVNTNAWCPISIDTVAEKGKSIYLKDNSYKEYFSDFKGWEYYFVPKTLDVSELEDHYSDKCKVQHYLVPIATNKVDKLIAIEFSASFHRWAHYEDEEERGWKSVPEKYGGSLTLLPTIDRYNTEPLIELLLQRGKEFEETPTPHWVNDISIPGEASLQSKIDTEKQSLEIVESRIKELESSLTGLQKYKGLLYETGPALQDLVKLTLEKLGAGIEPSIVTDEFIINIGGRKALIEVKGVTKSISKRDLGQLITDLGEHLKATDEEIEGILIGNAWRLLPLEQRDTHDKPVFPKNIIKIAENHNIGLISTTELFEAFRKTLVEPEVSSEILNKISTNKGAIKF